MANPKSILKKRLEGAERVAVLAVGSRLRGDDAAGLLAAEELAAILGPRRDRSRIAILIGEATPENLTGEIKRFQPTHLVVIDAADIGAKPGTFRVLEAADISAVSASTHNLPISLLTGYLQQCVGCNVLVIGIQPKACGFDEPISAEVAQAARSVADLIAQTLPARGRPRCE